MQLTIAIAAISHLKITEMSNLNKVGCASPGPPLGVPDGSYRRKDTNNGPDRYPSDALKKNEGHGAGDYGGPSFPKLFPQGVIHFLLNERFFPIATNARSENTNQQKRHGRQAIRESKHSID
jgi:hypothetical protein